MHKILLKKKKKTSFNTHLFRDMFIVYDIRCSYYTNKCILLNALHQLTNCNPLKEIAIVKFAYLTWNVIWGCRRYNTHSYMKH